MKYKFQYEDLLKIIIIYCYLLHFSNYSMLSKESKAKFQNSFLCKLKESTNIDILKACDEQLVFQSVESQSDLDTIQLFLNKNIVVEICSIFYNIRNKEDLYNLKRFIENNNEIENKNNNKIAKDKNNEFPYKITVNLGYFNPSTQEEFYSRFMSPEIYNK
jgi:hypothetical protein